MSRISIIVPTLNEANYLAATIENIYNSVQNADQIEILIIDAGSSDDTLNVVSNYPVQSFSKPDFVFKKYQSLNFGIEQSKGDVLIFLDADTKLPQSFDQLILEKLEDSSVVGGAFEFAFDDPDWKLRLLTVLNRIRYRVGKMYYGDQAVFCRKDTALEVRGYPERALMESAFFCKKLLTKGKLRLIKKPIKTSARRFNEKGFFKVTWFDIQMWIRFTLNLSLDEFGQRYWDVNLKSNG